jgi:hypothetical protein
MTLGGFDGTNLSVLTQDPTAFLASFNGGADSLMGTVNLTQVLNANANVSTLIGDYTVTSIMGNPAFVSNFLGVGGTGTFDWTLNDPGLNFTTLAGLLTETGPASNLSSNSIFLLGTTGSLTPVPLPPAIYLLGSVLGGAFWLSRRKHSAVSALGA